MRLKGLCSNVVLNGRNDTANKLNHMNKPSKILLSVPTVISFFWILTYWFPTDFKTLVSLDIEYHISLYITGLCLLVVVYLLNDLWKSNINISLKRKWTWFFIFGITITSLFYLWKYRSRLDIE